MQFRTRMDQSQVVIQPIDRQVCAVGRGRGREAQSLQKGGFRAATLHSLHRAEVYVGFGSAQVSVFLEQGGDGFYQVSPWCACVCVCMRAHAHAR